MDFKGILIRMHSFKISIHTVLSSFVLSVLCCQVVWSADTDATIKNRLDPGKSAYFSGKYTEAVNYLLPIAKQGNAESQYYMGLIYSADSWAGRDASVAISYLLSAADQNYKPAMAQISRMYEAGEGVEKDLLLSTDWFRKSKDRVVSNDIKLVSVANNDQHSSWSKEIEKIKVKANAGDADAQHRLASIYDTGKLIPVDINEAHRWYQTAANNGHQYSMFMTGYFLCRGLGGEVDHQKADWWFKKSGRSVSCH